MKFGEAMVSMENGKKVRIKSWPKEKYISLDKDSEITDENNRVIGLGSCLTYECELYTETVPISTLKEGDYFTFDGNKYRIVPKWMLENVGYAPKGFSIPAIRCYVHKDVLTCFTPDCIVIKL